MTHPGEVMGRQERVADRHLITSSSSDQLCRIGDPTNAFELGFDQLGTILNSGLLDDIVLDLNTIQDIDGSYRMGTISQLEIDLEFLILANNTTIMIFWLSIDEAWSIYIC